MSANIQAPEAARPGQDVRDTLAVIVVLLIGVAAGWLLKSSVEARSVSFTAPGGVLALDYPATWVQTTDAREQVVLSIYDDSATTPYQPTFRVEIGTVPEGNSFVAEGESVGTDALAAAANAIIFAHSRDLRDYRHLVTGETTLAGQPALRLEYGFVTDPPMGVGQAGLPVVVHGTDYVVIHNGRLFIFTMLTDASADAAELRIFDRILRSVRFG